jgi:hypothetical protein
MLLDQSVATETVWCCVDGESVQGENGYEARCAQIHRRLKRIVKARGALDAQEAAALREAQQQRVWRHYGYASLIEYMEIEMGYSPRVAIERLRVAKAIEELPVIADALTQGDLSFSAAKEITRVATPETEQAWVEAVSEKNVRQVEELVSGHAKGDTPEDPPDPKLRTRVLRYEVLEETAALERQVRQVLEKRCGNRLDPNAFISALFRAALEGDGAGGETTARHAGLESAQVPASAQAVVGARYQIAVTTCRECKRGWQDGSGTTVEMSPAALDTALCDAQHIGSLDGEDVDRAKQNIPPAVRRKVHRRDHGKCRVPDCRTARNLDVHHIVPREKGGGHDIENLITLCESHHLAHHAGALIIEGRASSPTIVRRAHNAFTIAKHAIDAGRALKEMGFDKHEVKIAIEKTRAHVGTTEQSLEQWIKIALRYCPRPAS